MEDWNKLTDERKEGSKMRKDEKDKRTGRGRGWEKEERRVGMEESVGWKERRTGRRLKRKERRSKKMQEGRIDRNGKGCRTEGEREMEVDERRKERRTGRG
jgi:hypothetical protein